jgi:hypothetical protein
MEMQFSSRRELSIWLVTGGIVDNGGKQDVCYVSSVSALIRMGQVAELYRKTSTVQACGY